MKRILLFVSPPVVGVILVALSGCDHAPSTATSKAAEREPAAAIIRVTAGPPIRKTLTLSTSQPGRIAAFEETPLHSKLAGYVEDVLVDIGDPVTKGQILLKLWIPELRDESAQKEAVLAQTEAEIKQAEAAVKAAEAAVVSAEARVTQAEAGIGRAEGEHARWRSELERMKELAARGSQTQKLVDETLNQFRAAEAARQEALANVESAKAALNEAQANVAKARADLVAAQARQSVATADVARSRTMLAYSEIKAPFDGVVTHRGVDTGHYVHPASGNATPPLLVVARNDQVRIFVDIPEMEAPYIDCGDQGDQAVVRVQSLNDREFLARITRTSWAINAANRSLRVEIDIPNEDQLLRPGMYAVASILLEERSDVLTLPITAVVRDVEKAYCCTVESGTIRRIPLKLGLRSGNEVEVLSGLAGGETVVLARADSLQDGQKVEVITTE